MHQCNTSLQNWIWFRVTRFYQVMNRRGKSMFISEMLRYFPLLTDKASTKLTDKSCRFFFSIRVACQNVINVRFGFNLLKGVSYSPTHKNQIRFNMEFKWLILFFSGFVYVHWPFDYVYFCDKKGYATKINKRILWRDTTLSNLIHKTNNVTNMRFGISTWPNFTIELDFWFHRINSGIANLNDTNILGHLPQFQSY